MILGMAIAVSAQQKEPKIVFDQRVHNFGKIQEDGGKVTHTFSFINQGGDPLIINRVNASCGCTTPEWTRKPVSPGGKGYVQATFDPRRRPGNFNKSVVVHTNASNGTVLLRIQGMVQRRERSIEEKYPRRMGSLRLKSHHLSFARIKHTMVQRDSLGVVNTADQPVRISFERVPKHITLTTRPKVLQPGEEGHIVVTDLMNRAMPFIRYKVEDVGIPTDRVCPCGRGLPLMERVSGRVADFLIKEDGSKVAGISLIENTLTKVAGIDQMQIVQEAMNLIRLRIVPNIDFSHQSQNVLIDYFKHLFGKSMEVSVEKISEIEPEISGKYRFSICRVPTV